MTNTADITDSKPTAPRRQIGVKSILSFFILLAIGMIDLPMTFVMVMGLIPTYVAYFTDKRPQKYISICVACFNVCGLVITLLQFWLSGSNINNAIKTLSTPTTWLTLLGCSAVGWVLVYVIPIITKTYLRLTYEFKISSLKKSRDNLSKLWEIPLD